MYTVQAWRSMFSTVVSFKVIFITSQRNVSYVAINNDSEYRDNPLYISDRIVSYESAHRGTAQGADGKISTKQGFFAQKEIDSERTR